jgi:molybdenum cofactor biosynthesis protein B
MSESRDASSPSNPSPKEKSHHHRQAAPARVKTLIVTVSDTRTLETDTGGALVEKMLLEADQVVLERRIVPDEAIAIRAALVDALANDESQALIFTGGTGIAPRDVTPDTIEPELDRVIPGFGEIFRQLSYEEIGSAALLSRALAGLKRGRVIFVIPGSRGAVRLAMDRLIVPELGHLAGEAIKTV